MRIVDANVLLYAVNTSDQSRAAARTWLEHSLGGGDRIGFAWVVLLGFLRLATKPGMFPRPLTVPDALGVVDDWLSSPSAQIVHPTERHQNVLGALLRGVGTGGNLTTDAHLAALAVEHRADIVSYDLDFLRFKGVSCHTPDALL